MIKNLSELLIDQGDMVTFPVDLNQVNDSLTIYLRR